MEPDSTPTLNEDTVKTALSPGRLMKISRRVSEAALKTKLLMTLGEEKVGTYPIECQALQLEEDSTRPDTRAFQNAGGKDKLQRIISQRDPEKVLDVVKLKIKYAKAEEDSLKKEYKEVKKELEKKHKEQKQERKFKRIIARVKKGSNRRWKKGLEEIRTKVAWCVKKFRKKEETNQFQQWVERVAKGPKDRKRIHTKVNTYDVKADQNEKDALALPPKFMCYPKVDIEDIHLNTEMAKTKSRYDRMGRDFTPEGEEVTEEGEKKTMEERVEDEEHREKFNYTKKTLDFRKLRPTDVKNCPKIKMPKARTTKEELELTSKQEMALRESRRYLREISSHPDNLTKSERRGINKLKKRVDAQEVVILQTDKSGKLCMMSLEMYLRIGEPHVKNDPIVDWEEVKDAQELMKAHLKMLKKIFSTGSKTN